MMNLSFVSLEHTTIMWIHFVSCVQICEYLYRALISVIHKLLSCRLKSLSCQLAIMEIPHRFSNFARPSRLLRRVLLQPPGPPYLWLARKQNLFDSGGPASPAFFSQYKPLCLHPFPKVIGLFYVHTVLESWIVHALAHGFGFQ